MVMIVEGDQLIDGMKVPRETRGGIGIGGFLKRRSFLARGTIKSGWRGICNFWGGRGHVSGRVYDELESTSTSPTRIHA